MSYIFAPCYYPALVNIVGSEEAAEVFIIDG